jgi:hypothetical protein
MLAAGEVLLRARFTGVAVLACLVGASSAGAQTPSPDPAPVPPPPVVEPTPVPEPTVPAPTVSEPTPKPKPKPEDQPAAVVDTALHPTFAVEVPYFEASRASAPKESVVPASAPIAAVSGSHSSPIVLILVFLLGSASLLVALLKDVPVKRFEAVPIVLTEHREVMYTTAALLLGIGVGLLTIFALQ